jgi:protein-L-isoaspartate(D-aspartate) O-methyltransferase
MDEESSQAAEARSRTLRAFYARVVAGRGGAADPRIERAFAAVPKEPFAGPPPWVVRNFGPWGVGGSTLTGPVAPSRRSARRNLLVHR